MRGEGRAAPVEGHALCEELADAVGAVQLREARMALMDEAITERTQPELRHGAVVHDHRRHVHAVHLVLHSTARPDSSDRPLLEPRRDVRR